MARPESSTEPTGDDPTSPPPAPRPRVRTWIVVVLAAVALVLGAVTLALVVVDRGGVADGPGTATFTWVQLASTATARGSQAPSTTFTGEIEGHAISGTSTLEIGDTGTAPTGRPPTGTFTVFRYRGTLAGSAFDLAVATTFPPSLDPADPSSFRAVRLTVTGTWGTAPVRARVTTAAPAGPAPDGPARFSGTVGHRTVVGTISSTTGSPTHQTATAHFVVSG